MRMKVWLATGLLLICTAAFAIADEKKPAQKKEMPAPEKKGEEKKKEMSPEEKAMMEAWAKAATPGDAHKLLEPMIGTWDAKVSFWSPAGGDPMTSTGVAERKWIMGGRFVEETFTGSYMNNPFSGLGYVGYDNVKKQYWGTWIDNMGTGVMLSTGSTSDAGKTWAFDATYPDVLTGKDVMMKEKITCTDPDHQTFEMWAPGPDGKLFKNMEIVYTRKKS